MSMRQVLMVTGIVCLTVVSLTAPAAVTDPNFITGVVRSNSTVTAPVLVNGGIQAGELAFVDRAFVLQDVNDLGGVDFIRTAVDDKADADVQHDVTVDKAGTLFVLIDNRVGDNNGSNPPTVNDGVMNWLGTAGFVETGYTVDILNPADSSVVIMTGYALDVTGAGTTSLYAQNDGSSRLTYLIAGIPAGWNLPPSVTGVPASAQVGIGKTLTIDATVMDFGENTATTVLWEQIDGGPAVTFSPNTTSEDVSVTFANEEGSYTLQMTVTDGDGLMTKRIIEVSVQIPTFAVATGDYAEIANDTSTGPDSTGGSQTTNARNYTNADGSTTRRRIAFWNWNISSLKKPGEVFFNSYLTINARSIEGSPTIHVYGIKEDLDNFTIKGYATWNNMPGVIPNIPRSTLIDESVLDHEDIVPLMEYAVLDYGPRREWVEFPPSAALDEFLNADTDGSVLLMFTVLLEGKYYEIFTPSGKESEGNVPYITADGQSLKGVIIQGNQDTASWATNPSPAINSIQSAGLAELSWTNPAGVGNITCDVYIGTGEPNELAPNYGYTKLNASPISGESVSLAGYTLAVGTTYNWIVDVTDDGTGETTQGYLWSFRVGNGYPVIALDNPYLYLWLGNAGDPSSATAVINATVTDEGLVNPEPALLWEQTGGPEGGNVVIDPNNVEDITLVLPVKGTYTFRLSAFDGELTSSATTEVLVTETPCEAAKAVPGYVALAGDVNSDCYVDLGDISLLALDWLECNSNMALIGASCN